jgi:hypothetical protein
MVMANARCDHTSSGSYLARTLSPQSIGCIPKAGTILTPSRMIDRVK